MIKITSGKGLDDLSCKLSELIDKVVKDVDVLLFMKGTISEPSCGFSRQVVQELNSMGVMYKAVNVLDDEYNPGVREAIKEYSQWPTIPQLYIRGEFFGGADIVHQSFEDGSLKVEMNKLQQK